MCQQLTGVSRIIFYCLIYFKKSNISISWQKTPLAAKLKFLFTNLCETRFTHSDWLRAKM
jgi:hypothetical protein